MFNSVYSQLYVNVIESFKLKLTKTDFSQFLYGTLKEGVNTPCFP